MKVAVFSDIHSNFLAFEACYSDALKRGAEGFILLGDYVSDLYEPRKTMDLIYEIQENFPTLCVRGNREAYMLDCEDGTSGFTRGSKTGSLLFTYEHLRQQDLKFFRSLPISDAVELCGVRMEIAHATMDSDRYSFDTTDGRLPGVFQQMNCDYLLTGHSHRQYIRRSCGKTIINPGSVGIAQDGDNHAKYALLEIVNGTVSCELLAVPYDLEALIHAQFASSLMDYAKYWAIGILHDVIEGDECMAKLLERVREKNGFHDEAIWHAEAVKLGMKLTKQEIIRLYHEKKTP